MSSGSVARRYGKALFDLAGENGEKALETCARNMADLVACLDASPELESLFKNPVFNAGEKIKVLKNLAAGLRLGKMVEDFISLLADKGRLGIFRQIAREFQALLDLKKGIVRGEFITAVPLSEGKRQELLTLLEKQAGRTLELEFSTDPALLGGMLLKLGDKTLDASLSTQLALLKDTIKRGE